MDSLAALLSHDSAGLAAVAILLAPAAWLVRRARSRMGRVGAWGAVVVLGGLGIGAVYHLVHLAGIRAALPPPGHLVDVGGYRIHVLAEGPRNGAATVVWMPGAHEAGYALYHLHAGLRGEARSVLIDRPGSGWSDPGPFPRTTARETEEIVRALAAAGERGPFVLVGHSFGGLLVANIARRYPQRVAAVVLLDATPPDAINYAPPNPYLSDMRRVALQTSLLRLFGLHHDTLARLAGEDADAEARRVNGLMADQLGSRMSAMLAIEDTSAVGAADYSIFAELNRGGLGWENSVYDGELGALPVYLVAPIGIPNFDTLARVMYAAGGGAAALGPEADYHERLRNFWDRSRERYLAVSTRTQRIEAAPGASHNFIYEDPEFVLNVIRRVLAEHSAGTH